MKDEQEIHRPVPGDAAGLGHVVENASEIGGPTPDERALEQSFPASDPPGFMSSTATPETATRAPEDATSAADDPTGRRDGSAAAPHTSRAELPDPREVP